MTGRSEEEQCELLRKEHNAAVANGLIVKARRIARVLDALAPAEECEHFDPHPELCARCAAARRRSA